MRILLLASVLSVVLNSLKIPYINKAKSKARINSADIGVFLKQTESNYQKSTKELTWREKYLKNISYNDSYDNVLRKISYKGGDLTKTNHFDPGEVNYIPNGDYELWVIINNEEFKSWNQAKNTLSKGDKVIFYEKRGKRWRYGSMSGGKTGQLHNKCLLKGEATLYSGGLIWLTEIKYYKKGEDNQKFVWIPVYTPNQDFCDRNSKNKKNWRLNLAQDELDVDISKEITFGKMAFLNDKIIKDGSKVLKINHDIGIHLGKFYGENVVTLPFLPGDELEHRAIWVPRNKHIFIWIDNPLHNIKSWMMGTTIRYLELSVTDFWPLEEIKDQKYPTNIEDREQIVKNILKQNNFFNFDVYSKAFQTIDVLWGQKRQNDEIQNLNIKMIDQKVIKNYNYDVIFNNIVKKKCCQ